jgi:hypothetical protein
MGRPGGMSGSDKFGFILTCIAVGLLFLWIAGVI